MAFVLLMCTVGLLIAPSADAAFLQTWQAGIDNGNQNEFVQENGSSNPPPGDPATRDDDWYFAGTYPAPVGALAADSPLNTFERALTGGDPTDRIHFNLAPDQVDDLFRLNVDVVNSNIPAGGIPFNVSMNGVPLYAATLTSNGLHQVLFSAAAGLATTGDNVIALNRAAGSGWMQFDYIRLSNEPRQIDKALIFSPEWQVGFDNGTQSEFSAESHTSNPPPGLPNVLDDDWYFAGSYPAPVGLLAADDPYNTFERALVSNDPVDRIHFNLGADQYDDYFFIEADVVSSSFSGGPIPFEILFNGVSVYSSVLTSDGLYTTPLFSGLAVGAHGGENIITLSRGGDGGWMQFDYVRLTSAEYRIPEPTTIALLGLGVVALRRRRK